MAGPARRRGFTLAWIGGSQYSLSGKLPVPALVGAGFDPWLVDSRRLVMNELLALRSVHTVSHRAAMGVALAVLVLTSACGDDAPSDGPVFCEASDGSLVVDLTEVSVIEEQAALGLGTFTNSYTIGTEDAPHRFIFDAPCEDGSLTIRVTGPDGAALPEGWNAVFANNSDSNFATDIRIDSEGARTLASEETLETTASEGPYILFIPPSPSGCLEYTVRMEATCPVAQDEDCLNGIDDDFDGLVDCDDADCNLPITNICLPPLRCGPEADDALEDNDTRGTATVINLVDDASANGYAEFTGLDLFLRNQDDDRDGTFEENLDWFRIDLCEDARMFVKLTANEAEPEAPYVIEVTTPDGQADSRSFYPDRENGRSVRIPFRLGESNPQPVFVRVRHSQEDACSSYDLNVGLTCGECFGQDALDGEDIQEPNETCLNALEAPTEGEPPFDASLRNEWPPNPDEPDQFFVDKDWYSVEVCAGGTLTATATVPPGVEPEYTLGAIVPGPVACEAVPIEQVSVGSGTQSVSITNPEETASDVYLIVRSDVRGACMRYALDWEITCP